MILWAPRCLFVGLQRFQAQERQPKAFYLPDNFLSPAGGKSDSCKSSEDVDSVRRTAQLNDAIWLFKIGWLGSSEPEF
jgi:hypothetical protein